MNNRAQIAIDAVAAQLVRHVILLEQGPSPRSHRAAPPETARPVTSGDRI
jgi:hypothetical protein